MTCVQSALGSSYLREFWVSKAKIPWNPLDLKPPLHGSRQVWQAKVSLETRTSVNND